MSQIIKQETINDKSNTKEKKSKIRIVLVAIFIAVFALVSYIQLRGSYLEYKELGEKYISVFKTNIKYRYISMGINFVFLYFVIYFTNNGIKKGLKPFFEKEKKEMPKLLNKSIALVISAIASFILSAVFMQKIMLVMNSTSFGITDPVFNLDISYYIFQRPLIELALLYFIILFVGLSLYMALYYVIVFNVCFEGIDGKMLKESMFMKKLLRNVMFIITGIALMTIFNTQKTMYGKLLSVNDNLDLVGAGVTETTVKLWGYVIFSFVIVIFGYRALKAFKEEKSAKMIKNFAVIPGYLVVLFFVMITFDVLFVNSNELDKEKGNIYNNIVNTKNAYKINIEEENVENSGTITSQEVENNKSVINNIPVIDKETVLKTLGNNQTGTGYYLYKNANLAQYEIDGKKQTVYVSPREIKNSGRTYNNKTYEYTHGIGEIITSATETTEAGNVEYIQKDITEKDEKINISESRIYFGLATNGVVATNAKNKKEYDYTDEDGTEFTSSYDGKAGLKLGFWDKLVLGLIKGDINLAFSNEITKESKILINRNIITRAKKALPYVIYDEKPYTVITEEGRIVWVLDGYTVSNQYPYAQYTSIEHDGIRENINYIRNSIKVIIDSYDGTVSYYITDRTDPIAMAYRNVYPELFEDLDTQIPQDVSKHFIYPEFLYKVQAEILKVYHNVKPDVLYRADDLWDMVKYNSTKSTKSSGTYLDSYYTSLKTQDGEKIGLVQIYTPAEKQNIISYLVGSVEGENNKLKIYKFSADSNIVSPMQLDKQIEEDEAISVELEALNTIGTKITKQMLIVPIEKTLLYVEPIYQTMLNESNIPILKKVVVASGNKVAIGNNLNQALQKLLSQYAVDIQIENTEDLNGLIEAIVKANENLTNSNKNNDWEMMGKDIQKLQELIRKLDTFRRCT